METNVFFFDIGGTLADVSPSGDLLIVRPGVQRSLERLRAGGCRVGVISNIGPVTPDTVRSIKDRLTRAGLMRQLDPHLMTFGTKDSSAIFVSAAARAGHADRRHTCAFIGEDPRERSFAIEAGLAALAPEILLV